MQSLSMIYEKPEVKVLLEVLRLSNMEAYLHSYRVAELVEKMLQKTQWSDEKKDEVLIGALLHDIGKAFIPLNLTQMPQSLTQQEYLIIQTHSAISYEIVKSAFSQTVQDICLYHHERLDGSGYLFQKQMVDIPKEVFLVQVADIYDALTNPRIYKKEYTSEEAIQIMQEDTTSYKLDDYFLKILLDIIKED